ncbi:MAG: hypothetical protein LBL66_03565 [Clostridiales bacterium]|jgi:hypothetical protein|nr:hypothetical protein [Clostridiales bacterium]
MDIFTDISAVKVYYTWKPCTAAKRRPHSIIVRDVRRLLLNGIMDIIYKDTKHRFIEISLIVAENDVQGDNRGKEQAAS